jgi:hypothetical protein
VNISDSGEFGRRLVTLAELFDLKLSPQRQALYFEALRDLSFDAVASALNHAAKSCAFFPKPAELRQFACGDSEDQTESAWLLFRDAMRIAGSYASVTVDDAALGETIVAVFGTWPAACLAELSPEMWASKRKEFGRVYRVMRGRNLDGSRYLAGIAERDNTSRHHSLRHVPVARIGRDAVQALPPHDGERMRQSIAAVSHDMTALGGVLKDFPRLVKGETA